MTNVILDRLPFFDYPMTAILPSGEKVVIKSRQIIVWVAVTLPEIEKPPTPEERFPVVLDTGFNDSFLIREQHLFAWTQIDSSQLPTVSSLTVYGRRARVVDAALWLFRNVPGTRDDLMSTTPDRVDVDNGIAICPTSFDQPRLPLLGLRTLRVANLRLSLDGATATVTLEAPTITRS